MPKLLPDKTFYPSPTLASEAPPETLAYVALLAPESNGAGPTKTTDALGVIDVDPKSRDYGRLVGKVDFPHAGNELHHFGWNACSSHLCGYAANPHIERRYLVVPGTHSSRIHVVDTQPDPRRPRLVKVIEGEEVMRKTGYAAPHTVHCGPDAIYMNALGAPDGDGPGGIFMLDHETFEVKGAWEKDRGPQHLAYDFWWHLGHDTMITSEWGTPNMVKNGIDPELLLGGKYGNALHVWDLKDRTHLKKLELGAEQQMVLELRPAHNPRKAYGFVGVVLSLANLSSSIWMWYRDEQTGDWSTRKIIEIPAEPAKAEELPPLLQGFKAVPPLVSDINLSLDDRFLYVSCWGTGELRQYDVSDPLQPRFTGSVKIGGIVRRGSHPSNPDAPLNGGPQMVAAVLGIVMPLSWLRWLAAGALLAFGIFHLVSHRHPRSRRGGMTVGAADLTVWSFIVSSAHGAGLMVLPFVLGMAALPGSAHAHATMSAHASHIGEAGLLATLLHTASYLAVAGAIAWVVYTKLGLRLLRTAWINVNVIWAVALIITAVATTVL